MFVAAVVGCACVASAQEANWLSDVSLSTARGSGLAALYQQVVREATETYRGDFQPAGTNYVWPYQSHAHHVISERYISSSPDAFKQEPDPFPPSPFELRVVPETMVPPF